MAEGGGWLASLGAARLFTVVCIQRMLSILDLIYVGSMLWHWKDEEEAGRVKRAVCVEGEHLA